MRGWVWAAGLLLAPLAWADQVPPRYAEHDRVLTEPQAVIQQVRQQLDRDEALDPAREREALWWMGTAGINIGDDAALAEATLRLDSLSHAHHDAAAAAAAGFLRARHLLESGGQGGLAEALRAAAQVQDTHDDALAAWATFQLCDAYTMDENAEGAVPVCLRAEAAYRRLADSWGMAETENNLGINYASQQRIDDAVAMYQRSRQHFSALGADAWAASVGDNLARVELQRGRPAAALALSQESLAQEEASGRVTDALLSRANIARTYAALGQPEEALRRISGTVEDARHAGKDGLLPDLLQTRSEIAEQAKHYRQALADAREVIRLISARRTPASRTAEATLEARYAERERELRIRELERENRLKDLALKAAQAEAARRDEAQRRQELSGRMSWLVAAAMLVVALLLYLLLSNQRRHAAALREQALRDPLTGVDNRRAFLEQASALVAHRPPAGGLAHVLMLIDFDHFKRINDGAGHPQGDRVLVEVSAFLRETVGPQGQVSRIGGEEFAVLCPTLGADAGMRLAESLRAGVAALPLPAEAGAGHITVSIGVALFDAARHRDLDGWMRAADAALYSAKSFGRDRVVASTLVG